MDSEEIKSSESEEGIKLKKQNYRDKKIIDSLDGSSIEEEDEIKDPSHAFDLIMAQKISPNGNKFSPSKRNKNSSLSSERSLTDSLSVSLQSRNEEGYFEIQERMLRDSFIKTYMLIFTNEQNNYLLLDNDLIEITLNCLEYGHEIKIEA